jgi:hypothetical protein
MIDSSVVGVDDEVFNSEFEIQMWHVPNWIPRFLQDLRGQQ